mgnify:CR=1 FL=1
MISIVCALLLTNMSSFLTTGVADDAPADQDAVQYVRSARGHARQQSDVQVSPFSYCVYCCGARWVMALMHSVLYFDPLVCLYVRVWDDTPGESFFRVL